MTDTMAISKTSKTNWKISSLFERAARSVETGDSPRRVLNEDVGKDMSFSLAENNDVNTVCDSFQHLAEAVRDREQQQHNLIATAAHDLRNPLSLIDGAARMLKKHDTPEEDREYWLDCILRNVFSLQVLVEDFNDDIKAFDGRLELRREKVNLCDLAREVVRDFRMLVPRNPICFEGEGACWVLGDYERLKRLLLNLLSNAVKYSGEGREVNVSVWRHGTRACLIVQDEGKGIPPAETERLFLPYTRLDKTRHSIKGDGLGLHSVKTIADAHGAEINVQGTPGRGTTFEIAFNLCECSSD